MAALVALPPGLGRVLGEGVAVPHPVLQLVAGDGGAARVVRRGPGHRQAVGGVGSGLHRRNHRGQGRLRHVVQVDGHGDAVAIVAGAGAVSHRHGEGVAGLRLEVVAHAGLGAQLPRGRSEVERARVLALQAVGQGLVGVGGGYPAADVLARRRVLGEAARRVGALAEDRRALKLLQGDRDGAERNRA